jgi:triosephosphate isomerase (TIM)
MTKRKKIIVGNWKMNPKTAEEAKKNFSKIKRLAVKYDSVLTIICPSEIHLMSLVKISGKGAVRLGVQDVFEEDQGLFTGQVSSAMAYDAGARYAIVGHSEKRRLGETNEQVAKKIGVVVRDGLVTILCVGEKERDRDGNYLGFLKSEILESLGGVSRSDLASRIIIAYEPIWEIGRPDMQTMKPGDIHSMSIYIKKILNDAFGNEAAMEVPILYGGSVGSDSARIVVYDGEVDGLLVGRQSLDPEAFGLILKNINDGR